MLFIIDYIPAMYYVNIVLEDQVTIKLLFPAATFLFHIIFKVWINLDNINSAAKPRMMKEYIDV